jgi:V/A-type H+-transporting ATPase subunit D
MARLDRVPPGRAGRLWLQHRLGVARRGSDVLEQKLRILKSEARRLSLLEERTGREWTAACDQAEAWMTRAAILVGERGIRHGADSSRATVTIRWGDTMGVRHPAEATCSVPAPQADAPPLASGALITARAAYGRAVEAAVEHAVAQAAVRVIAAEEAVTRRRLRAITYRWLPLLTAGLRNVELNLEEEEHADGVRLRSSLAADGRARPGLGEKGRVR